jgi:hypothetical protein
MVASMIVKGPSQPAADGSAKKSDRRHVAAMSRARLSADQWRQTHQIAFALVLLCTVELLPSLWHLNLSTAPDWSRAVLLGSLWQLAFVVWMATIPDRGSVWVLMLVFAVAATVYGAIASIALLTADEIDLPLGLASARWPAFWWSSLMAVLCAAAAFYCGHTAQRWRQGG